jgi:hypothetical protein
LQEVRNKKKIVKAIRRKEEENMKEKEAFLIHVMHPIIHHIAHLSTKPDL